MPYESAAGLPDGVRKHLPTGAQEIYREAFNSAWERFAGREASAYKGAWSAVKTKYRKTTN